MRKVLIVDDDPNVASLVKELLTEEGFMSVHAGDLETAWATLLAEDPDAAIVDLWLHGREAGWELVDRIRYNEHFQNLPVVIVTASSTQDLLERAQSVGAEAVAKPFTPAALIDRLRRAMSMRGRGPGTRAYDVVLLTNVFKIEGTVHVDEGLSRFSDAWEALVRDPRQYVPLTKAIVRSLDETHTYADHELIEIRKADIVAMYPKEWA